MKNATEQKKKSRFLSALCIAATLALLISSAGATYAKYIREDRNEGAAVAAPFYFTSDRLTESQPYYRIDEPAGEETVEIAFRLQNYVDDLRCTKSEIKYTYRAVSGSGPSAAGIGGAAGEGALAAGGSKTHNEITLNLKKSDFTDGVVTVIATASTPYEKTISAQFGFTAQQQELQWSVSETGGAVVLKLAGGKDGAVEVVWPEGLYPDMTNPIFEGETSGQTDFAERKITFAAQSGVSYAITFLKANESAAFSKEDFTVTAS